jgi:hypothetical protein
MGSRSASRGRRPEGGESALAAWGGRAGELRRARRRKVGVQFGEGRSSERTI